MEVITVYKMTVADPEPRTCPDLSAYNNVIRWENIGELETDTTMTVRIYFRLPE